MTAIFNSATAQVLRVQGRAGRSGRQKTCLVLRFIEGLYNARQSTIGAFFLTKNKPQDDCKIQSGTRRARAVSGHGAYTTGGRSLFWTARTSGRSTMRTWVEELWANVDDKTLIARITKAIWTRIGGDAAKSEEFASSINDRWCWRRRRRTTWACAAPRDGSRPSCGAASRASDRQGLSLKTERAAAGPRPRGYNAIRGVAHSHAATASSSAPPPRERAPVGPQLRRAHGASSFGARRASAHLREESGRRRDGGSRGAAAATAMERTRPTAETPGRRRRRQLPDVPPLVFRVRTGAHATFGHHSSEECSLNLSSTPPAGPSSAISHVRRLGAGPGPLHCIPPLGVFGEVQHEIIVDNETSKPRLKYFGNGLLESRNSLLLDNGDIAMPMRASSISTAAAALSWMPGYFFVNRKAAEVVHIPGFPAVRRNSKVDRPPPPS